MAFDPERERKRLAEHYAGMSDGEIEELARDARLLTDVAKAALRFEIARRELGIPLDDSAVGQEIPAGPVVLRRFFWLHESMVARSVLDSAGIECYLPDENTLWMDWLWTVALGYLRVWVRPEDAEDAAKLLDQDWTEEFIVDGIGLYKQPRCPKCGSLDVSFRELIKSAAGASLLAFWLVGIGPPIRFRRSGWKCHACGDAWADLESGPL